MKIRAFIIGFWVAVTCMTCQTEYPIIVPEVPALPAGVTPVPDVAKTLMEGVYTITSGVGDFGDDAVVKWSGEHISIFVRNKYLTFETGVQGQMILMAGYWRVPTSDGAGKVSMIIDENEGAADLLSGVMPSTIIIKGLYGLANQTVSQDLSLTYSRPFSATVTSKKFRIVGHRGGGRTSDRLPISENSIPMIGYAGRLGANGVEIDVRLTKDGIPVLYHDGDINIRLTQKSPINGPIENFTFAQLQTFVRLIRGEEIPTFLDALYYAIDSTDLEFVWIDTKAAEAVPVIRNIQEAAIEHAQDVGRNIEILIGIPAQDVLDQVKALSGYTSVPTLCEISVEETRTINARAYGPRWTLGTQNDLVEELQAEGRIAICWTVDVPAYINQFINQGRFDGLLTNYPSYVAYYFYIQP